MVPSSLSLDLESGNEDVALASHKSAAAAGAVQQDRLQQLARIAEVARGKASFESSTLLLLPR